MTRDRVETTLHLDLVQWDDIIFAGMVVLAALLFAAFVYVLFRD